MEVSDSRWMVTETLIRSWVNLCVLFVIMCTIFTTPKEGEESVLDQTMNFTALLILIDLDTIFAQLLTTQIEKLNISFEYDPETLEDDFNRAAEYHLERKDTMYYWQLSEKLVFLLGFFFIGVCVIIVPAAYVSLYLIFPPK